MEPAADSERPTRIGLVVPSSNVTMETEIPAMLQHGPGRYTFHSSRMRMQTVSPDELKAMDAQGDRCANELVDARCDVLAYACLVAIMVQGPGSHRVVEQHLRDVMAARGCAVPVVSSAGALVDSLHELGAQRIAIVAPYVPALTEKVVTYLAAEGIEATSVETLSIEDNHLVGCIPPSVLRAAVERLDLKGVDALVLSACVQMPSLSIVDEVQRTVPVPVLTAATATAAAILRSLGHSGAHLPGAVSTLVEATN